jgi:hypothetical protein
MSTTPDPNVLLARIENIVENPVMASAPVAVAPINWGVARRMVSRASKRIKNGHNGVHTSVLAMKASLDAAKRSLAARKAARTRKKNAEKRSRAAKKAARTRARTTRRKHGRK